MGARDPSSRGSGSRVAVLLAIVAAALLPAGAQAELRERVNHDLSARPGPQAGSALAIVPGNPDRGAAATTDPPRPPVAYVSDAAFQPGRVATRPFPTRARNEGGISTLISPCCDPALAAHSDGTIWMAVGTAGGRIAADRIAAGGNTFNTQATLLPAGAGEARQRPAVAVGPGGRIAVAWLEAQGSGPLRSVAVSICASGAPAGCDETAAWSEPARISAGATRAMLADLAYAPDGRLHAVWWDAGTDNAVEHSSCAPADGCDETSGWSAETTVRTLDSFDDDGDGSPDPLPARCPIIAAPSGHVGASPAVEVGPDGRVAVAFSDLRDNPDPARPSRCTASGSDKTFDSFVAVGNVPGDPPPPAAAVRVSPDGPAALNDHFLPALSVDPADGRIEVAFSSTRADPSGQRSDRLYTGSADGSSFEPPIAISTASSRYAGADSTALDYGTRQGADSSNGVFRAAWTDNRALQARATDLYVNSREAETTIFGGPPAVTPQATAQVSFATTAPRAECRIDAGGWRACRSPLATGPLPNGPHRVAVRATDAVGNPVDLDPPSIAWTTRDRTPPETLLTRTPRRVTKEQRPRFEFAASEPGSSLECLYDDARFDPCPRGVKSMKVGVGRHVFRARATDVGGNVDPSPAVFRFARIADCSQKSKPRKRNRCKKRNAKLRDWARSARF
jgi:hypothetical protein